MAKLTLNPLASLANASSAVSTINVNWDLIEAALENTLSRDGTSPNEMESQLDMNSNAIINLPAAVANASPVRKAEFDVLDAEFDALETTVNASITAVNNVTATLTAQLSSASAAITAAQAIQDASENIVRVASWFVGKPTTDEILFRWEVTDDFTINATSSVGSALTAATAETVLYYKINGSSVLTATFAISGTEATFALVGSADVSAGDILTIEGPSSEDGTLAGVSLTLVGTLVA